LNGIELKKSLDINFKKKIEKPEGILRAYIEKANSSTYNE
jgi:hypothetical protein